MVKRTQSGWLRILSVFLLTIFFFVLVGCGDDPQTHKHVDSDGDGVCDECSESIGDGTDPGGDESDGEGDTRVVFYWNDGTDRVYLSTTYNTGNRIKRPAADPEINGKAFIGWYAEAEGVTEFSFTKKYDGEQRIYAKWFNQYTFEAEYTQLTGLIGDDTANSLGEKIGHGYSNETSGLKLIEKESDMKANCSNGYSIGNNFVPGFYLEFVIESDTEVTDAQLMLRLSCAYYSITLSDTEFSVSNRLQGVDIDDEAKVQYFEFDDIVLETEFTDGYGSGQRRPFTNHFISGEVHLYKGTNIVRLEVTNNIKLGSAGTVDAKAPMIDCIYVNTNATLTWEPYTDNIAA